MNATSNNPILSEISTSANHISTHSNDNGNTMRPITPQSDTEMKTLPSISPSPSIASDTSMNSNNNGTSTVPPITSNSPSSRNSNHRSTHSNEAADVKIQDATEKRYRVHEVQVDVETVCKWTDGYISGCITNN